jgi:hypothetical protein
LLRQAGVSATGDRATLQIKLKELYRPPAAAKVPAAKTKAMPVFTELDRFTSSYPKTLPISRIDQIAGPISYREYRHPDFKLALFGERHDMYGQCSKPSSAVTFSSFLGAVLKEHPDRTYDVYIESPYKSARFPTPKYSTGSPPLNQVEIEFDGCLRLVKDCSYPNLRMHYMDYRYVYTSQTEMERYFRGEIKTWAGLNNPFKSYFMPEMYGNIVDSMVSFIMTDSKLQKEIRLSSVSDYINAYIISTSRFLKQDYSEFFNINVKPQLEVPIKNNMKLARQIFTAFLLEALIMDVYMLARVFRKSISTRNIIIYVGDAHANQYARFITKFMGVKQYISYIQDGNEVSCVNMRQGMFPPEVLPYLI